MTFRIIRGLAAILSALILAFAGVVGVEYVSATLHPLPPGVDPTDLEACKAHVARYPTDVLFVCALGWWATVLISCWMATRLGPHRHLIHGIVVGSILLALAVINMAMLPYAPWFWINLLTFPASSALGIWLGRGRENGPAGQEMGQATG